MRDTGTIALCVLVLLTGHAGADTVVQEQRGAQFRDCLEVTVKALSDSPLLYERRRVCLAGYLRRMVPYGEDSAALVDEKSNANWRSNAPMLNLSIPFTLEVQEKLSHYSEQKLHAVGTFRFDRKAYPDDALLLLDAIISR
jgi:hypothetical protein